MSRHTEEFWQDKIKCDYCGKTIVLATWTEDDDAADEPMPQGWVEWTRPPEPRGDWPQSAVVYPGWRTEDYTFCCKAHLNKFRKEHPPKIQRPTYAEYMARPQSHIQYTGMPEFW